MRIAYRRLVSRRMTGLLRAFTVAGLIVSFGRLAEGQSIAPGVAQVEAALRQDGRAVSVSGTFTITYEYFARPSGGCKVEIASREDSRVSRDTASVFVDLSQLSPQVRVVPWSDSSGMHAVDVFSANGDSVVFTRSISVMKREGSYPHWLERHSHYFTIPSDDSIAAGRLAAGLAGGISACGGKVLSPRGIAIRDAEDRSTAARADSTSGRDDASLRARLLCQNAVREGFKSPLSAVFSAEFITGAIGDKDRAVLGKVEATNGFGGRLKSDYMCSMTKFGNSWILKRPPSVF